MYGYIKVAMAVPKVSLADVKGNLQDIKEKILKAEDGYLIHTNKGVIEADILCIAAGGYPKLSQFDWLNNLGHTIVPPVPSLFTFNLPKHPIRLIGLLFFFYLIKCRQGSNKLPFFIDK